jgi:hypothetical protein
LSGFLFIQIRELLIETIVAPVVSLLVIWPSHLQRVPGTRKET